MLNNTGLQLDLLKSSWRVNYFSYGITIIIIILAEIAPTLLEDDYLWYFTLLLILSGILHGASDYFIHKALIEEGNGAQFNLQYWSIIAAYALIWYLLPNVALLCFILISLYHFGQSNWYQYQLPGNWLPAAVYILWGAFVTLTPILIHLEHTNANIENISHLEVHLSSQTRNYFVAGLLVANVLMLLLLKIKCLIHSKTLLRELANLLVLFLLFINTPALLGFAVYFACWHSIYSTVEQVNILQERMIAFSFTSYCKSLLLMAGIAFAAFGLVYYVCTNWLELHFGWGILFLFISLVTLPHSYFIDKIYKNRFFTS